MIAFGLAVWSIRRRAVFGPLTAITGLLYTIPSLFLFPVLVPITGLTVMTAVIPLVLYTLLIFLRNMVAGFDSVPRDVLEAADGMGYTRGRRFRLVEMPLATPLIVAGRPAGDRLDDRARHDLRDPRRRVRRPRVLHLRGPATRVPDRDLRRGPPDDRPRGRRRPRARLAPAPNDAVDAPSGRSGGRGEPAGRRRGGGRGDLMGIIEGTARWLADPAHWVGPDGIPTRVTEHILLSGISLLIAMAIALPIGIAVGHTGRGATLAINGANLGRALPSLAVMGIVIPLTTAINVDAGFKIYPAVIALIVLGLPPILVNAHAGVSGVDREVVESGRGMGMTARSLLWRIELPIAVVVIIAGIRSASAQIIATATLAAIFAGPGLGRYLVEGYAQLNYPMMVAGVIFVGAPLPRVGAGVRDRPTVADVAGPDTAVPRGDCPYRSCRGGRGYLTPACHAIGGTVGPLAPPAYARDVSRRRTQCGYSARSPSGRRCWC